MAETPTSQRRDADFTSRGAEPPDEDQSPFRLLLRRLSDRQFQTVLNLIPRTPAHLRYDERFVAATRLAYPRLGARYWRPGPGCHRLSLFTRLEWEQLSPQEREEWLALRGVRRLYMVVKANRADKDGGVSRPPARETGGGHPATQPQSLASRGPKEAPMILTGMLPVEGAR